MSESLPVSQRPDAPGGRPKIGWVLFILALMPAVVAFEFGPRAFAPFA